MAQKKQDQKDTLDTVFDFIFSQAEKPPEKRKPIKPTRIHGTSEVVEALTTVLEKPGLYVSEQTLKNLEDGLNVQLAEVYLGTNSPQGKTKIGTKDLIDIIKDPNLYFDKAYQKSNPKFNMADWSGKTFRGINAATWAKKHGIKDKETLWAINRASASFDDPSQRFDLVREAQKTSRKYEALLSAQEACKKYGVPNLFYDIGNAIDSSDGIRTKGDLERILRSRAGISDDRLIESILNDFSSDEKIKGMSDFDKKLIKGFKSKPFQGNSQNIDIYRNLNSNYFKMKAQFLRSSSDLSNRGLADSYDKASLIMNNWRLDDNDNKFQLLENKKALQEIKKQIRELNKANYDQAYKESELNRLKNTQKDLRNNISFLQRNRGIDKYFKYKGMWTSMNNIYLHGNLVGAILDGTFFSDSNTILNPVNQTYKGNMTYTYGKAKKNEKGEIEYETVNLLFNIADNDSLFVFDPHTNSFRLKNKNLYNDTMTTISYLTPQKLFQINGEFFAYREYKNNMKMFEKLLRMSEDQETLAKKLVSLNFFTSDGRFRFDNINNYQKIEGMMNELQKLMKTDTEFQRLFKDNKKVIKMLERFSRQGKVLHQFTNVFSLGFRMQEVLKDTIANATITKWRKAIADRLLKRVSEGSIWKTALSQWAEGAGAQVLARALSEQILLKLGLKGGTFIFTQLSGALSLGFSYIAFFLYKELAIIIIVLIFGVIAVIGFAYNNFNSYMTKYSTVAAVEPGEVVQCEEYDYELIDAGDFDTEVAPAPSNASCPLGSSSIHCTQGYTPGQVSSHKNITDQYPVDLRYSSYIYAPQYCNTSKCTAKYMGRLNCSKYAGDAVQFSDSFGNTMIMYHVAPVGAGTVSYGETWTVKGGEAFARVQTSADGISSVGNGCWTGVHLHLEVTQNGKYVDPLEFLQSYGCNVPDEVKCDDDLSGT